VTPRHTRRAGSLAIILLSFFLGLLVVPSSAQAANQAPYPPASASVSVSRSTMGLGDCTVFSGKDWMPGSTVVIKDRGKVVSTQTVASDGTFSYNACYSKQSECGTHQLTASGTSSDGRQVTLGSNVTVACANQGRAEPVVEEPQTDAGGGADFFDGAPIPFTGLPVPLQWLVSAATLLLLVGGLLMVVARRRRHERDELPA
jgi:hypothetical protein